MNYRLTLVAWTGVVILLLLAVIGYTQGWFGTIFGSGFLGTRATTSGQAAFDQGTYAATEYSEGTLRLQKTGSGQ